MSLSRSWALCRHEYRLLFADSASLLSLVLMPLVMMAFFKPLARLALAQEHAGANGSEYTVPAMTTMFAFFLVGFIGFQFFAEHRWNTWERLRASQVTNAEILVGKTVPALTLSFVQQGVLFAAGYALFGLRIRGSLLAVFAIVVALSVALTAVGLTLAAVLKNEQQMNVFANLGAIILAGVSGAMVPLSLLPAWAKFVAPAVPQYWAMRALRDVILEGEGLGAVALPVAVLAGFAVVFAALALARFRFDEPKVRAV